MAVQRQIWRLAFVFQPVDDQFDGERLMIMESCLQEIVDNLTSKAESLTLNDQKFRKVSALLCAKPSFNNFILRFKGFLCSEGWL